jgi:hypothetical protein
MTVLSSGARKALKPGDFAIPEKAPGPCSLPIPDMDHVRAARELCHKCGGDACDRVEKAVDRKFGESPAEDRGEAAEPAA